MFILDPFRFGVAGPAEYYWNPADKASEITLSGGDQTATRSSTNDGNWRSVRSVTSHSSGQWYAELINVADGSANGDMIFGLLLGSGSLSSYPGSSTDGAGLQANNFSPGATKYYNGSGTFIGVGVPAG